MVARERFGGLLRILVAFLLVGMVGGIILNLPGMTFAHSNPGWLDLFFVSISAVTVTGLSPLALNTYFTVSGQLVILLLIQVGGLGIMTLTSLVLVNIGRRISIRNYISARQNASTYSLVDDPRKIFKTVVVFTSICEGLFFAFLMLAGMDPWPALFHSISAFCNAGFSTLPGGLVTLNNQPAILALIMIEFILGGIGFTVVYNLYRRARYRHDLRRRRITVHTRLVLWATGILLSIGCVVVLLSEWNHALAAFPVSHKVLYALFTSATARTAGFEAISTASLSPATLFLLIGLMYIGASPGSTGGGVKTTTVGVFVLQVWSRIRGHNQVSLFHRSLSPETVVRATTVLVVMFLLVGFTTFLLLTAEGAGARSHSIDLMFEAVSALGTVGLSTGVTSQIGALGKVVLMAAMLLGRLGPLSLALMIREDEYKDRVQTPIEEVMIG